MILCFISHKKILHFFFLLCFLSLKEIRWSVSFFLCKLGRFGTTTYFISLIRVFIAQQTLMSLLIGFSLGCLRLRRFIKPVKIPNLARDRVGFDEVKKCFHPQK